MSPKAEPSDKAALEQMPGGVSRTDAWWILFASGLGALIAQMFGSVIATALPAIQNDLQLTLTNTTWIATSYFLCFGIGLIIGGRMADLWGEVRMIAVGYALFGVGLVFSAVAQDALIINGGRVLQGLGVGIAAPATLSIVINVFPVSQRGFAVGTWGFAHSIGIAIGPILGGLLTQSISWRYIFWLTLPLTLMVIIVTIWAARHYEGIRAVGGYDWPGFVLGAAGLAMFVYGLQLAGSSGWTDSLVLGLIVGGLAILVVFFFIERRVQFPLVDFALFTRRLFLGGFLGEFGIGFVYVPALTLISALYMITVLGYGPIESGVLLLVLTGTAGVIQPLTGRLVDLIGPRLLITVGLILAGIGLVWLNGMHVSTSFSWLIAPFILLGLGAGTVLPSGNSAGMLSIRPKESGMAAGVLQAGFVISNSIGLAVVGSYVTASLGGKLQALAPSGQLDLSSKYAEVAKGKGSAAAEKVLSGVSNGEAKQIRQNVFEAFSQALGSAFFWLGVVSFIAAVTVFFIIGRHPGMIAMEEPAESDEPAAESA